MRRIFPLKIFNDQRGMTLIEIMIVLAIVAGMVAVAIPRLANRGSDHKKALQKFRLLTKKIQYYAKIKNNTYRLVIDLARDEERKEEENYQSYWVEASTSEGLNYATESNDEGTDNYEKKKKQPDFSPDTKSFFKKRQSLPYGIEFKDVEIAALDKPITSGLAHIYFSPQGLVDESTLHISLIQEPNAKEKTWTIAIHPLTGRSDVFSKNISLNDLRKQ